MRNCQAPKIANEMFFLCSFLNQGQNAKINSQKCWKYSITRWLLIGYLSRLKKLRAAQGFIIDFTVGENIRFHIYQTINFFFRGFQYSFFSRLSHMLLLLCRLTFQNTHVWLNVAIFLAPYINKHPRVYMVTFSFIQENHKLEECVERMKEKSLTEDHVRVLFNFITETWQNVNI